MNDDKSVVRRRDSEGNVQVGKSWESLIERQIREAAAEGAFDNLPHQGEPLPDDRNPYAADMELAFGMLKNAGYAPPWIEADKYVRELLAKRDAILKRAASGPAPTEIAQRRDRSALEEIVAEANGVIAKVNAEAPSSKNHRQRLGLADEIARYDEACRR